MKTSLLVGLVTIIALGAPAQASDHPIGGPRGARERLRRVSPANVSLTRPATPTQPAPPALLVNGLPVTFEEYRRVVDAAAVSWNHLLALFPVESIAPDGQSREEFLFLHEHAEPLLMRARHAAEVEALERRAAECHRRALAGEDMALLVLKYSTDPDSPRTKGDTGLVRFSDLPHPLNRLAWQAEVGDVLAPVQTAYGYHVLKITEILPPREVASADGGAPERYPDLRRARQALLLWNSDRALADPTFQVLRAEVQQLPEDLAISVLDDRLCAELPNWCAARPEPWRMQVRSESSAPAPEQPLATTPR